MSGFAGLMEALRQTGLQELAPALMLTSIRSLNDLQTKSEEALRQGATLEQILILEEYAGIREPAKKAAEPSPAKRWDHPPVQRRSNASMSEALAAAKPENRAAALSALNNEILAPSS